ncbi:GNAT family N-acetyltransferase [Streptomyces sp. NPDC056600]|uniref:GNAT family N-acetyltransferase n=1 Tax=Streptomyces sp. NPDC056600 TaxID=3345874 RepID=UPI003677F422
MTALKPRERTDADLPACAAALRTVHERDGYPLNWPADPAAWLSPPSLVGAWVAERDGLVVGHAALSRPAEDDLAPGLWGGDRTGAVVVNRLFVSPAARGLGAGAALLEHLTAEAAAAGRHPVLDVLSTDTAAVALYRRLGWRHLGDREQRWGPRQTVTLRCFAAPGGRGTATRRPGRL